MSVNITYLRDAALADLKKNVSSNLTLYTKNEVWLSEYFKGENFALPSNLYVDDFELKLPEKSQNYDLENTIIVFEALKSLTVTQAADERLWAYLTHVTFWEYMRLRWPAEEYEEKETPESNIKEKYFFMTTKRKAVIRNGLARLWWYGYASYDPSRANRYELTEVLLRRADDALNLLERNFSNNPTITRTILSALAEKNVSRDQYRNLMKYINWLGGVTVLDSLNPDDLKEIIEKRLRSA